MHARTLPPSERETIDAFLATEYRVILESDPAQVTISVALGVPCPTLAARLDGRSWCIITACNPGARRSGLANNLAATRKLEHRLRHENPDYMINSINRDPSGNWPDEPGWLFTWNDASKVHDLAAEFGQLGVVCAEDGWTPELWLYRDLKFDPGASRIRVVGL